MHGWVNLALSVDVHVWVCVYVFVYVCVGGLSEMSVVSGTEH